jgi:hypothetical protein
VRLRISDRRIHPDLLAALHAIHPWPWQCWQSVVSAEIVSQCRGSGGRQ